MRKPIGKIKNAGVAKRLRRRLSIRKKINGSTERPRICFNKTNKNLFAQVIDDSTGTTIVSAQTFGKSGLNVKANKDGAKELGTKIGGLMKEKNLEKAVFDRAGQKYHGVVATFADAVRESGIQI